MTIPSAYEGGGGPWPPVDHAVAQAGQAAVERLGADRLERPREPEPCRPGLIGHPHRTGQPGAELHDLCTTRTYTLTVFSSR